MEAYWRGETCRSMAEARVVVGAAAATAVDMLSLSSRGDWQRRHGYAVVRVRCGAAAARSAGPAAVDPPSIERAQHSRERLDDTNRLLFALSLSRVKTGLQQQMSKGVSAARAAQMILLRQVVRLDEEATWV